MYIVLVNKKLQRNQKFLRLYSNNIQKTIVNCRKLGLSLYAIPVKISNFFILGNLHNLYKIY